MGPTRTGDLPTWIASSSDGRALRRRHRAPSRPAPQAGGGGRMGAALGAGLGGAAATSLPWLSARAAHPPVNVHPELVAALTAGVGAAAGLVLAVAALLVKPIAGSLRATILYVWVLALGCVVAAVVRSTTGAPARRAGHASPASYASWSGPHRGRRRPPARRRRRAGGPLGRRTAPGRGVRHDRPGYDRCRPPSPRTISPAPGRGRLAPPWRWAPGGASALVALPPSHAATARAMAASRSVLTRAPGRRRRGRLGPQPSRGAVFGNGAAVRTPVWPAARRDLRHADQTPRFPAHGHAQGSTPDREGHRDA
jgi:hypothetical protein